MKREVGVESAMPSHSTLRDGSFLETNRRPRKTNAYQRKSGRKEKGKNSKTYTPDQATEARKLLETKAWVPAKGQSQKDKPEGRMNYREISQKSGVPHPTVARWGKQGLIEVPGDCSSAEESADGAESKKAPKLSTKFSSYMTPEEDKAFANDLRRIQETTYVLIVLTNVCFVCLLVLYCDIFNNNIYY